MLGLDLRPIAIKNFINYSLVRLGIDTIDLYQPCRLDNSVPVEDGIGTVADLIKEGKVRYLGVSGNHRGPIAQGEQHPPRNSIGNRVFIGGPPDRKRPASHG